MAYLKDNRGIIDADSADDAAVASELLAQRVDDYQRRIAALPVGSPPAEGAELRLEMAAALVDLGRGEEAFAHARQAFDAFMAQREFESAVRACDVMFQADQPESLSALGQGVWLGVTFPILPDITVAMLQHIVDDTPEKSDGAAVAATVAHFLADVRCEGKDRENLMMFTSGLLGTVARRHSDVETQTQFDYWFNKLELNDPDKFLPRLRNVVDVLVQDDWWFDRDSLQDQTTRH